MNIDQLSFPIFLRCLIGDHRYRMITKHCRECIDCGKKQFKSCRGKWITCPLHYNCCGNCVFGEL